MKTNKIKEPLFSNKMQQYLDDDEQFYTIQMANFKTINNKPNYVRLQDQNIEAGRFKMNNASINNQHNNMKKVFANQPVVPNASYNFEPNHIVMNGITFVHKDTIKGIVKSQKKQKKPQMQVMCQQCCSQQMVPANTHAFICYNCALTQRCCPQYGIFICGHCEKQVWYGLGTSQYIKCTKCGTINKVPQQQLNENRIERNNQNPYGQKNHQQISFEEISSRSEQMTQKYFSKNYPEL